ncbi:TetR/AcrR family transcriptional regulator, partial [Pseudomonas sp. R62]
MRVSKAQAQANREHIVETASVMFRERGYDGVGVADLMAAAGFTHGGFYKHFGSKADLMTEASANSLAQSTAAAESMSVQDFINVYVSRDHRDGRSTGCTMAALCGDAARQSGDVKAAFAEGIERTLQTLGEKYPTAA